MPRDIVHETFLIVEGKEDERFFGKLAQHLGYRNIQIEGIGGKTQLHDSLKALRTRTGFSNLTTIGIIRDADANPKATFQSVCGALKREGFGVPRKPLEFASGQPRVTVMILPGGNESDSGMLEDVCLKSLEDDPKLACVDAYFQCLTEQNLLQHTALSKARVQVYLASREPELRLGEAAEKSFWPWDHPAFDPMKQFLRQMVSVRGS